MIMSKKSIKRIALRIFLETIYFPFNFKNKARWKQLKDSFNGKRVFLIGNGPSLNHTPLYMLKDEYMMCFNRFPLILERLNFNPYFYMVVDDLLATDIKDDINFMIDKSTYSFFPNIQRGNNVVNFKKIYGPNEKILWLNVRENRLTWRGIREVFSNDLPNVNSGRTVAIAGLQILMHLGFSEIYIVGVDMNYVIHKTAKIIKENGVVSTKDDDPNHFDPRYFGNGRQYHQPVQETMDRMLSSLNKVSLFAKAHGYHIYNATRGGRVECFERVIFENLFPEKDKYALFKELLFDKCGLDLDEIDKIVPFDLEKEDEKLPTDRDYMIIKEYQVELAIKSLINQYIPLGPYDEKYFLINRRVLKN
jgi:hypothetical protein